MTKRVRVNAHYYYLPVLIDKVNGHATDIAEGEELVVVNLPGCPKANTMGHCYVNHVSTGKFAGLVCTNSLVTRDEYIGFLKAKMAEYKLDGRS
jgi:hypothetical protein